MHIDDAGRHIFAGGIDARVIGRDGEVRAADSLHLAIAHQHGAMVNLRALPIQHRRADQRRRHRCIAMVG